MKSNQREERPVKIGHKDCPFSHNSYCEQGQGRCDHPDDYESCKKYLRYQTDVIKLRVAS